MRIWIVMLLSISVCTVNTHAEVGAVPERTDKNGYIEPFKMFDNVYYIGDKWVSSYAVTTAEGLVIIDTLSYPFSQWIPGNLRRLGLKPDEIDTIFVTHGHSDHVGGAHFLQSNFSSSVLMLKEDYELAKVQALNSRGVDAFKPPVNVEFVSDGSSVVIGETKFTFYRTPGHTDGCLSIDFHVRDRGKAYRAFVVGGMGTNFSGVDASRQYLESVKRIRTITSMSPAVSINLANHPQMAQLFDKRARAAINDKSNPFINRSGFEQFLDELEQRGKKKLQMEFIKIKN